MHQGRFSCILASKYSGSVSQRLYSTVCGDRLFKLPWTPREFFLSSGHPKHCFKVLSTANQSFLPKFSSPEAVVAESQTSGTSQLFEGTVFENHPKVSFFVIFASCEAAKLQAFVFFRLFNLFVCQSSVIQQLSFTKTSPIL